MASKFDWKRAASQLEQISLSGQQTSSLCLLLGSLTQNSISCHSVSFYIRKNHLVRERENLIQSKRYIKENSGVRHAFSEFRETPEWSHRKSAVILQRDNARLVRSTHTHKLARIFLKIIKFILISETWDSLFMHWRKKYHRTHSSDASRTPC